MSKRGRGRAPGKFTPTPTPTPVAEEESVPTLPTPFKNPYYKRPVAGKRKNLKQIILSEKYHLWPVDVPTYSNVDASPSLIPVKKYCDITGLEAFYTEPKTGLRYHSTEIYRVINLLPPHLVQEYLGLRGAQVILK